VCCRHQFPPTPSRTDGLQSGIPQWQRAPSTPSKPPTGSSEEASPDHTTTAVQNGEQNTVTDDGEQNTVTDNGEHATAADNGEQPGIEGTQEQ